MRKGVEDIADAKRKEKIRIWLEHGLPAECCILMKVWLNSEASYELIQTTCASH